MRLHLTVVIFLSSSFVGIILGHNLAQQTLDLTTPVTEGQRAQTDMPGGGSTWHTGQGSNRFQLPLNVRIVNSWVNETGDITVEILLKNRDISSVHIPVSRDITRIGQTASKARSLFFLRAVPVYDQKLGSDSIGSGETGGSPSMQGTLMRLEPGDSIRVLIPIAAASLRRSLPKNAEQVEVRITCEEWRLDDQRYFINATSDSVLSVNTIVLGFRDGKPTILRR